MLGAEENAKTSDSAQQEEQQTLGQKLTDEAHSLCSQSLANRDLTASHTGPGEQEIGDVDATATLISSVDKVFEVGSLCWPSGHQANGAMAEQARVWPRPNEEKTLDHIGVGERKIDSSLQDL
jgi:hypothetical protein